VFKEQAIIDLFESTGVLSAKELLSRFDVYAEQYVQSIEVEAKLVVDIATTRIYPAAIAHIKAAAAAGDLGLADNGLGFAIQKANAMMADVAALKTEMAKHDFATIEAHLKFCSEKICPLMLAVRKSADALEGVIDDELWPLPKYFEMFNIK
jgi:glutamine synthetase